MSKTVYYEDLLMKSVPNKGELVHRGANVVVIKTGLGEAVIYNGERLVADTLSEFYLMAWAREKKELQELEEEVELKKSRIVVLEAAEQNAKVQEARERGNV